MLGCLSASAAAAERGAKLDERACLLDRRRGILQRADGLFEQTDAVRVSVGDAERTKRDTDSACGSPAVSLLQFLGGEPDRVASLTDGG
jgi:hypothetical protein